MLGTMQALTDKAKQSGVGCTVVDADAHTLYASKKFCDIIGKTGFEGSCVWERIHPADHQRVRRLLQKALAGKCGESIYRVTCPRGWTYIRVNMMPLWEEKQIEGIFCLISEVRAEIEGIMLMG